MNGVLKDFIKYVGLNIAGMITTAVAYSPIISSLLRQSPALYTVL